VRNGCAGDASADGSGQIAVYDAASGRFDGLLRDANGHALQNDRLRGLQFGNLNLFHRIAPDHSGCSMNWTHTSCALLVVLVALEMSAQTSPLSHPDSNSATNVPAERTIALSVPTGTPLQIALDREVRVKKAGQTVHARLMQPVYAFDHLVLPAGAEVNGHISRIGSPGGKQLTLSILNADFTPPRPVEVAFDDIVIADGKRLPLHATVVPGSGQVIRLVDSGSAKGAPAKSGLSAKIDEAKQEWRQAMSQIKQPGKMHRVVRLGIAQLPIRPQYIDAGTLYYADLQEPLNFGDESRKEEAFQAIGTLPPPGSLVRASLVTPLDSGTTKHGAPVQAVVSKPLFDGDHLILPQGTLLNGSVLQVRPAGHLKRNGQLRISFHELVLPNGPSVRVETTVDLYNDNLDNIARWTRDHMGGRPGICIPETLRFSGQGFENEFWLKFQGISMCSSRPAVGGNSCSTMSIYSCSQ
jgi:hypothetical protein